MREARVVGPVALLALAWWAAFNLRAGFVGLGPVLPALAADLRLAHTEASVLVAIPTLMMGLVAVPGGRWADRAGPERTIAVGLLLVAVAGALRAGAGAFPALVALTVLFGAGIGLSQPALPRLMRARFPGSMERATGVYANGLISGSIVSASLTGPVLLAWTGAGSWRGPLAFWGGVALVALALWLAAIRPWAVPRPAPPASDTGTADWSPWRSRAVWLVAALFAAQGIAYYLLVAWLPAIYAEHGLGEGAAAALFAVFNAATFPAIVGFPLLSERLRARRPAAVLGSLAFIAGSAGFVLAPLAEPWRWLWPALAGAGVAGLFALTLVMPADVAPRGRTGAAAGLVLGVGYGASALGPVLAGAARDLSGSFAAAVALLPAMGLAMLALSLVAPEVREGT